MTHKSRIHYRKPFIFCRPSAHNTYCSKPFRTYDIKSVLSTWALTVLKIFHLVVILIFEDKIFMYDDLYIAQNTAQFAECSPKLLVISFCGFPLPICASQVGSLQPLVMHKALRIYIKEAACDAQVASVNNLQIVKHFLPCTLKHHLYTLI